MPPAVAQAPIVTRNRVSRRTWRIRSTSAGVVIEPSTSAMSNGPGSTWLLASRKYTISSLPAKANSSSSSARNESWQPSHEANLNTASLGVRIQSPFTSRNGSILS